MQLLQVVISLCGLTLLGLSPMAAWSHAFPQRAEPRVGATLAVTPTRVRIWFDGALEPAFSTIRVQTASGQPIDQGDGRVDPVDATLLEVNFPPLAAGTYRVIWSVVARDGHRTEGDYTFSVQQGN